MSPTALMLGLLLMAQDDGPITTARKVPQAVPSQMAAPPENAAGYVAWCSSALQGYVGLYDRVMPEVKRIERMFPGPDGATASLAIYPQLRDTAREDIERFSKALAHTRLTTNADTTLEARIAEGSAAGARVWANSELASTAHVARLWMSWSPPDRCSTEADRLEQPEASIVTIPVATPIAPSPGTAAPLLADAPLPPVEPVPPPPLREPTAAEIGLRPATTPGDVPTLPGSESARADPGSGGPDLIELDPDNPTPCPGRLEPIQRDGGIIMMCRVSR